MKYEIKKLQDSDPVLFDKVRKYCHELNGCCQEVHAEMGPFLNEYMYQEALAIIMKEKGIPFEKEYCFSVEFHGQRISHKHYMDFLVRNKVIIECKAVNTLCADHRQQLWNYMRLTKTRLGILFNFAPVHDQSEHYYLDTDANIMYFF